ncbi:MAG TPA: hypothetical protein VEA18_00330 [Candidatus Kapabacteria bacterium]|nr:hypothetical protein [Candidatus Kapabacteria bacterium]
MKFVTDHLTNHHLFHAPHKWFLALLGSPIHLAELHYKKRYHLNYARAKQLFIFDMALLLSMIVLLCATLFWFLYDPTVVDDITLTITPTSQDEAVDVHRLRSGERVTYRIAYENNSRATLTQVAFTLQLPKHFFLESVEPYTQFVSSTRTVHIPNMAPGAGGDIILRGLFYGVPNTEEHVSVRLSYTQEKRGATEEKITTILTTLRESTLKTTVTGPDRILGRGVAPVSITLQNTGRDPLYRIRLPFPHDSRSGSESMTVSTGTIADGHWVIPSLIPGQTATSSFLLSTRIPAEESRHTMTITPSITVNERSIEQYPGTLTVSVEHPALTVSTAWTNGPSVRGGERRDLQIRLTNTGRITLTNASVSIPFPSAVDAASLARENVGRVEKNTITVTSAHAAQLKQLEPGASAGISITVPLKRMILEGKDITLSLTPTVRASVANIPGTTFETTGSASAPLRVGTSMALHASSRYYTADGDQLGRGPIPPTVGKETKYWVFVTLTNATSDLDQVAITARLAPGITWTGKKSVSHGNDVTYDPASRIVRWTIPTFPAHGEGGMYMELAVTPTESQRGTHIPLLQQIAGTGEDAFIGGTVTGNAPSVDTSLRDDVLGRQRGTLVR